MANRKMTFTKTKIASFASALILASVDVSALGLGVLDVQSNLDQPLNGEIELRVNSGDDVNSVRASIASRADFANFGIDYPSYLDNVQVNVDRSFGNAKLKINSSNVIIKEPFIHFLVRIDWSGGSFLREYTALIDPPTYAAETPRTASQPKAVGSDQSFQSTYNGPSQASNSEYNQTPTISPSTSYNESSSSDQDAYPTDARYGPVESGETLSVIATELSNQYPDLSIYQIMKVLFEQNPSAFINGNINGLIKGAVLNLGDINAIRAVDIQNAKDFFSLQAADWNNARANNRASDDIKVGQDEYQYSEDTYTQSLNKSTQENFQVGASSDTESLISDSESDARNGEIIVLREQVSELESSLSSSELEKQELKERVSILEGQLADMNDLMKLNVDDADLASLEDTLAKRNDDAKLALTDGLDTVNDTISGSLDGDLNDDNQVVDDGLSVIEDTLAGTEDSLEDAVDVTEDSLAVESEGEESVVESVETSRIAAKPIIISEPEPSLFEKIKTMVFDDGLWKIIAIIGALLVGAFAALFIRRRRADDEFEISMLSIESNSQSINTIDSASLSRSMSASVTASVDNDDGGDHDQETSFLTVYSDSDAVVQADEVDPIAEADVYIAYGRHEQAEEVLLDGVTNYPERIDIKHKLLSVYQKNNNAEGFERVAEELYSQRESLDPVLWNDVCRMGREIDSSNPLFELSSEDIAAGASASSVVDTLDEGESVAEAVGDVSEVVADTPEPLVEQSAVDAPAAEVLEELDDASIQLINFDEGRSEMSELDEVEIDALDFDVPLTESKSEVDLGDIAVPADDDIEINDTIMEFESGSDDDDDIEIQFDDSDLLVNDADTDIEIEDLELDADLDFSTEISIDLEDDDGEIEIETDEELISESLISDIDFDLGDDDSGDFDLGELEEVSGLELDDDYDELRTQYELAKVFADLGDEDGARKILNDIVADTSAADDVVADSKELLESLS